MHRRPQQLASLLVALRASAVTASVQCWFPDGTTPTVDQIPCNSSASDSVGSGSACCLNHPNDYCMANGLCFGTGIVYRGSCTDKSWNSPACSQACSGMIFLKSCSLSTCCTSSTSCSRFTDTPSLAERSASANLFPCGAPDPWQCEYSKDCSQNFTLPGDSFDIVLRDDQLPGAPNAVQFANPAATFVAANSTALTSSNSSISSSPGSSAHTTSSPLAVGLGVGLALGALLIVALVLLFFQHRRTRNALARAQDSNSSDKQQWQNGHTVSSAFIGELPENQMVHEVGDNARIHEK